MRIYVFTPKECQMSEIEGLRRQLTGMDKNSDTLSTGQTGFGGNVYEQKTTSNTNKITCTNCQQNLQPFNGSQVLQNTKLTSQQYAKIIIHNTQVNGMNSASSSLKASRAT